MFDENAYQPFCSGVGSINVDKKIDSKYKKVSTWYNFQFRMSLAFKLQNMLSPTRPLFTSWHLQYIPRNMHTVFALLCFVVVIHWLIFPYPSGLLHWHCGNLTIDPVPAKQPWWIWINTSCEFIMNDCVTTTKQSTTKPCAYFLGYTVCRLACCSHEALSNELCVQIPWGFPSEVTSLELFR